MVKDASLVVQDEKTDKGWELVLKRKNYNNENRDTKLGDVLEELPAGKVYKDETGLGATTLELKSNRHSIIVEPLKITASSKADDYSKSHEEALYVGSQTLYHKKYVTDDKIVGYFNNENITWKKVVVVADSLWRIEKLIGERLFKEFFVVIDEIDSFQLDSTYRDSMENCLDVYKKFPKGKRAMVSATFLDFSDPDLADEPKTFISYDKPTRRIIDLYFAPKRIKSVAVKRIAQNLKEHPSSKLMVAFNSVSGCYDIATHLNKHYKVANEDIRILCSKNSETKIGSYYAELNSDVLPAKITFVASAYFTGFDLHERYHLVSISWNVRSVKYNFQSLSDKRIKQIAGRCRDTLGLLSESVVYDILLYNTPKEKTTKEHLLDAAKQETAALNCIKRHYSNHPLLRENVENIRKLVAGSTETRGYKLVRIKADEPVVSYLNLDAYLEMENIQIELYSSKETLAKRLTEAGHKVQAHNLNSEELVETNAIDKKSRSKEIKDIVQTLRELEPSADPLTLLDDKDKSFSQLKKYIVRQYAKLHGHLKPEPLLTLIEKASDQRDSRLLNKLFFAAYYFILDKQAHYKRLVRHYFPFGEAFTPQELFKRWNKVYLESGTMNEMTSTIQAIRITKLHFKTTKKRGSGGRHTLKTENPFHFELIKARVYNDEEKAPQEKSKRKKSRFVSEEQLWDAYWDECADDSIKEIPGDVMDELMGELSVELRAN